MLHIYRVSDTHPLCQLGPTGYICCQCSICFSTRLHGKEKEGKCDKQNCTLKEKIKDKVTSRKSSLGLFWCRRVRV